MDKKEDKRELEESGTLLNLKENIEAQNSLAMRIERQTELMKMLYGLGKAFLALCIIAIVLVIVFMIYLSESNFIYHVIRTWKTTGCIK